MLSRCMSSIGVLLVVLLAPSAGCGQRDPENESDRGQAGEGDQQSESGAHQGGRTIGSGGRAGSGGAGAGVAGSDASGGEPPIPTAPTYAWDLPSDFPTPVVPEDNPLSEAKIELGRHLFYDKRLSLSETQSCASCHEQALAFTDGRVTSLGSTAQAHPRNAMSLANVGYAATLTWANPLLTSLEAQALVPMFGTEPVELGLNGQEQELLSRLRSVSAYAPLFEAAYPEREDPFTLTSVVQALASFQRVLISSNSRYDRHLRGDATALTASEKRGAALFGSERLECFHCHSGFNLQDAVRFEGKPATATPFHNTALYNIDGRGAYPEPNTGVYALTQNARDMGRFRVPTLRNIAVTGPYMHDGSIASLSEVLDHYAAGGRSITEGDYAGDGSKSPLKSPFLVGFEITATEREDVLAFFESLTDTDFLTDPRFANPWP